MYKSGYGLCAQPGSRYEVDQSDQQQVGIADRSSITSAEMPIAPGHKSIYAPDIVLSEIELFQKN